MIIVTNQTINTSTTITNQQFANMSPVSPLATMRFVSTTYNTEGQKMVWYKSRDGKYVITQLQEINVDVYIWKLFKEFNTENEMKLFLEISGINVIEDSNAKVGDMLAKRYDDTYSITTKAIEVGETDRI